MGELHAHLPAGAWSLCACTGPGPQSLFPWVQPWSPQRAAALPSASLAWTITLASPAAPSPCRGQYGGRVSASPHRLPSPAQQPVLGFASLTAVSTQFQPLPSLQALLDLALQGSAGSQAHPPRQVPAPLGPLTFSRDVILAGLGWSPQFPLTAQLLPPGLTSLAPLPGRAGPLQLLQPQGRTPLPKQRIREGQCLPPPPSPWVP